MKKILVIILFSVFISRSFASEADRIMQKANKFYQDNEYEKAAELYEQIVKNGYENEALFYNLGNAYFKLGKLGYAILYYEKALKLDPNDDDANYNLKIANARTTDKIEVLPKLFYVKWWETFLNIFSIEGWSYFAFSIYILLLASIALYFLSRKTYLQKWAVIASFIVGVLFLVSVLFLFTQIQSEENTNSGVVIEQVVTAKLSPDDQSGDAFVIHEGMKVNLEDQVGNWVKIKLPDGKIGWMQDSELKKI